MLYMVVYTWKASSGQPSGRTMGLCVACVGVHADVQAAVQIVESNQHSDLLETLRSFSQASKSEF